jgi:hypothetical protein
MDKYYAMAAQYFTEVEGRQLYPKLLSLYWLTWAISFSGFGYVVATIVWSIVSFQKIEINFVALVGWEVMFIASTIALQVHKSKKFLQSTIHHTQAKDKSKLEQEKLVKKQILSRISKKQAHQFAATVKEISELRSYEKASRTIIDVGVRDFFRALYDPESKARILSLFLALAALLVTLLKGSELAPLPDLIAEIDKQGGPLAFSIIIALKGMYAFFILGGIILGIRQGAFMLSLWTSKLGWSNASNETMLNHMMRDLVMLHDPEEKEAPEIIAAELTADAPKTNWLGLTLLIGFALASF